MELSAEKLFAAPRFWRSVAGVGDLPSHSAAEIAFAGRSNAGKSSALNAVCRRRIARISRTPGRTRMINYFSLCEGAFLLDLPGYGYAAGASAADKQNWAKTINACLRRENIRALVLIIDCRRGLADADCRLLRRFAGENEAIQKKPRPAHILLSKSDKLNRADGKRALTDAVTTAALCGAQASAQLFSALKKTGVTEARNTVAALLQG